MMIETKAIMNVFLVNTVTLKLSHYQQNRTKKIVAAAKLKTDLHV